jgi:hypothetical protein
MQLQRFGQPLPSERERLPAVAQRALDVHVANLRKTLDWPA